VNVLREIERLVGAETVGFADWLFLRQKAVEKCDDDRRVLALVVWRAFWEAASLTSELTGDLGGSISEKVRSVFDGNFRSVVISGGFAPAEVNKLNEIVLREVLRASFVQAYESMQKSDWRNI
jgi:hypothetical protein